MPDVDDLNRRIRLRMARQRALVEALLELREQLQGSLFIRYGECGKETCACRQGRKHGPYYVLSLRGGGRGGFAYLQGGKVREARTLVRRYRSFRGGLRRLRKVNLEIVALLRRYQAAGTRRAGRRLGVAGSSAARNI